MLEHAQGQGTAIVDLASLAALLRQPTTLVEREGEKNPVPLAVRDQAVENLFRVFLR